MFQKLIVYAAEMYVKEVLRWLVNEMQSLVVNVVEVRYLFQCMMTLLII